MEAEAIVLDRVITRCHHWLYYCNEEKLLGDFERLLGMMEKSLADVKNKHCKKIFERATNYNLKLTHIKGKKKTEFVIHYPEFVHKYVCIDTSMKIKHLSCYQ